MLAARRRTGAGIKGIYLTDYTGLCGLTVAAAIYLLVKVVQLMVDLLQRKGAVAATVATTGTATAFSCPMSSTVTFLRTQVDIVKLFLQLIIAHIAPAVGLPVMALDGVVDVFLQIFDSLFIGLPLFGCGSFVLGIGTYHGI